MVCKQAKGTRHKAQGKHAANVTFPSALGPAP
jgi:hypothetical protein